MKTSSLLAMLTVAALALTFGSTSKAQGTFQNGGFESGTFASWIRGSGYWYGDMANLDPTLYQVGGLRYDASADASAIVGPGDDPIVGNRLNRVFSGNFAARVNNSYNDSSVSTIRQTVNNYTDKSIYFAWAAVLEDSHGPLDSDNFRLTLSDDTTHSILYDVTYNSANTPAGLFKTYGSWYYTDWQVQALDVSNYVGDTFTLSLLASDCPYGGHAGYVYLDGFGAVIPVVGAVPEPSTYGAIGAVGLLVLIGIRRRRVRS